MPRILFVCTANVCRSPMASALLRKLVTIQYHEQDWDIESAGTWAQDGYEAVDEVQQVLRNRGIDLSSHRSRIITLAIIQSADLVLTMEKGHKEALLIEFPRFSNRIFLLSEIIDQDFDIVDPIGGPLHQYEETARLFEKILSQGFEKISHLVRSPYA